MSLPQTMSFIEVTQPGGPDAMTLATGPLPLLRARARC